MRNGRRVPTTLALFAIGILYGACDSTRPTELVAGITTQMQVPKDLKAVGFILQPQGQGPQCKVYPVQVEGESGFVRLPSTLAAEPSADPKRSVTVTIIGFKRDFSQQDFEATSSCLGVQNAIKVGEDDAVILRRSRSPYVSGKVLYLPMPLRQSCKGVACASDETTCKAGKCVSMDVDPAKLREYRNEFVFGSGATCFPVTDQQRGASGSTLTLPGCFSPAATTPVNPVDRATCLYEIPRPPDVPDGFKPQINVRIAHADLNLEVLDVDPSDAAPDDQEGFTVPDPVGKPWQFRLAPNLCELVKAKPLTQAPTDPSVPTDRIVAVQASVICPPKTLFQPLCDGDVKAIQSTGTGDPTRPNATCLARPYPLRPAESTLYVVMDRSRSMRPYFGERGLKQVLDLSLQDPALDSTNVGFKFVPAMASDCGSASNTYATLSEAAGDVPFLPPEPARQKIALKVGDVALVRADDPPLYLDAALRGAYGALATYRASRSLNRQAVLVIGNHDFGARCEGGQRPAELAAAAAADKTNTYVIALARVDDKGTPDDLADDERTPPDPTFVSDAAVLATSGGTQLFDATVQNEEGARAVASVLNDLSSCLYEFREPVSGAPLASLTVSYLGFAKGADGRPEQSRVEVAYNDACTEATQGTQDGWSLEGAAPEQRLRICGGACTSLRESLLNATLFAATGNPPQPSAGIPVQLTRPCD